MRLNKLTQGFLLLLMIFSPALGAQDEPQVCLPNSISATSPASQFELKGGLAVDKTSGLMWQRCFLGASGDGCTAGKPNKMNWPEALQYIEKLNQGDGFQGFKDWRMPNIRELGSIAELQCVFPTLNPKVFPNAPSGRTWSSSPYQFYPHYSWFVDFGQFEVNYLERHRPFFIILVRAG